MTLVGHEKLERSFKKLIKEDRLSQGYIFFGEAQVGKFTFAKYLVNFLEAGEFEEPTRILSEALFIKPITQDGGESIGIDEVRRIKKFLYEKPVNSKKRTVIIDDAEQLTLQAQNAILKIAEEPPRAGLLILIVPNHEALLPTVQSRFQKVYFPRASKKVIKEILVRELNATPEIAGKIAEYSFGRIGRAKGLVSDKEVVNLVKETAGFLKNKESQQTFLRKLVESDKGQIKPFITAVISELAKDTPKNYLALKAILGRFTLISQLNLNKRLQLETALLWNT